MALLYYLVCNWIY